MLHQRPPVFPLPGPVRFQIPQLVLSTVKLRNQAPCFAAVGFQGVFQQLHRQLRLFQAVFSGGAVAAGPLPGLVQQGFQVNGRRLHFQDQLLSGRQHLRPKLQPHLGNPRLSPAVDDLRPGRQQRSQSAAQHQSRQRRPVPLAAGRHDNAAGRSRGGVALPFLVKGDQPHKVGQAHHRCHGNRGDLGQVQPQPCQSRRRKGPAHCQRPGGGISQAQIRPNGNLGQGQHPQSHT